jgi:phosphoribosylaminoimidazole synthetase
VDTEKASNLVKKLEKITKSNYREEIIDNPSGFCSMFDLKKLNYKDPILLSSTDGVGTKLNLAIEYKKLDYLGIDLVAMCVNDILASGGEPLFFLDYFSSSKISKSDFIKLIKSINQGCKESGCSLIGGETAEMPGLYKNNDFDLAGFAVGVVERKNLLDINNVKKEDFIIGLESSGFHSNGFSLIRKILKKNNFTTLSRVPFTSKKKRFGDELLVPTKIYVKQVLPLIKQNFITSIAHITGGGIYENLTRAIPQNLKATIEMIDYKIPEKFLWLQRSSKIKNKEMLKTFNCGIGMILVVNSKKIKHVINYLKRMRMRFHQMGRIEENSGLEANILIKRFGEWDSI